MLHSSWQSELIKIEDRGAFIVRLIRSAHAETRHERPWVADSGPETRQESGFVLLVFLLVNVVDGVDEYRAEGSGNPGLIHCRFHFVSEDALAISWKVTMVCERIDHWTWTSLVSRASRNVRSFRRIAGQERSFFRCHHDSRLK